MRMAKRRALYALTGLVVNVVFFATLEICLRLAGFQYSRFPRLMQQTVVTNHVEWQNTHRELMHFVPDSRRMWKPEPNFGTVNAVGYQGAIVPIERDASKRRILFLGDSCTNAGADEYPEKVISLLAGSGIVAEPLIAGAGGYSTTQGLSFFGDSLVYRPDVVVAYFGWNDHWIALGGAKDADFRPLSKFQLWTYDTFGWLRIYQVMHYLIFPPRTPKQASFAVLTEATRVPPTQFVDNVDAMIELAKQAGMPIVFVVPPFGKGLTNPAQGVLFPPTLIPRVHVLYRELLRKTVERRPDVAHLVDFSPPEFDDSLMRADGIHPTPAGYSRVAEALAAALVPLLSRSGM
jgi:lysophospholipase L1-like esterase